MNPNHNRPVPTAPLAVELLWDVLSQYARFGPRGEIWGDNGVLRDVMAYLDVDDGGPCPERLRHRLCAHCGREATIWGKEATCSMHDRSKGENTCEP